jgi:hypothetical protein
VRQRDACDNGRIARSPSLRFAALACGLAALLPAAQACSSSGDAGSGKNGDAAGTGNAPASSGGGTGASAGKGTTLPAAGGTTSSSGGSGAGAAPAAGGAAGGTGASTGGVHAAGDGNAGGAAGTAPSAGGMSAQGGRGAGGSSAGRGSAGSGTAGSAGAAPGSSVCGTAAENDSATLSCPAGQIIDAVVFASFGTPAGTCGSFTASSCDAAGSAATVQALCAGKRSCSVPATNSAFGGDPCHDTTKKLAVEVTCVPGEPSQPEPDDAPYKGLANSPAAQLSALGATWCYNWGDTPKPTDCDDPYFVPMIWGASDVSKIDSIAKAGYTTVLGFNEPNKSDQANLSVADAVALWPQITKNAGIRVSSPAVSDDGRSWLEDFMKQAKQNGLRVDFIAMHWYGWNKGSCVASQLEGAVKWASQWGLPVWITEFGCMGSSNPDEQTVLDFFDAAIPMLAKHSEVERYAWYPWNTYNEVYTSGGSPMMTALGQAFAAAPRYRQ